ncbi:MAG: hypothetical protein ACM3UZ_15455 [Acidobacteriota bacterium]
MKLNETVRILMSNITFFLAITLIIWVPAYAIIILKNIFYTGIEWPAVASFYGALLPGLDINKLLSGFISMCIDATIISLIVPYCGGVAVYGALKLRQGRPVGVLEALTEGFKKWWTMLCVSFIYSVLVFLGCLLFIIPGIILAAVFSLVFVNAIAEQTGIWQHFERSIEMARHRLMPILGAVLVVFVILGLISIGLQGAVYLTGLGKNQVVVLGTGLLGQLISLVYWVFPVPFYTSVDRNNEEYVSVF